MIHSAPGGGPAFDPPVRMTDDGRLLLFCIDLPGIAEEQIRIDLYRASFTISVLLPEETLEKTVKVPKGTRFAGKRFCEGVLEIRLAKPVP